MWLYHITVISHHTKDERKNNNNLELLPSLSEVNFSVDWGSGRVEAEVFFSVRFKLFESQPGFVCVGTVAVRHCCLVEMVVIFHWPAYHYQPLWLCEPCLCRSHYTARPLLPVYTHTHSHTGRRDNELYLWSSRLKRRVKRREKRRGGLGVAIKILQLLQRPILIQLFLPTMMTECETYCNSLTLTHCFSHYALQRLPPAQPQDS